MPRTNKKPLAAIMLCTMNGAPFIEEQLASIAAQTVADFVVLASDDGSTDDTVKFLKSSAASNLKGRLRLLEGPGGGFQNNFLSVFTLEEPPARYIAFCDQDDVWMPDKLERAVARLGTVEPDRPAIYGSRTILIDETGREIGLSRKFPRHPGFGNALVQSLYGGNTLVMNEAAWRLARRMLVAPVVSHDWWMYQIVSGAGGEVLYDAHPTIRYRQHRGNLVGENRSMRSRFARLSVFIHGRYRLWNETNIQALLPVADRFTAENRMILEQFAAVRDAGFAVRVRKAWRLPVYRQSTLEGILLRLALILKKA